MDIYSIFMYWKSEYCPSANTTETIKSQNSNGISPRKEKTILIFQRALKNPQIAEAILSQKKETRITRIVCIHRQL